MPLMPTYKDLEDYTQSSPEVMAVFMEQSNFQHTRKNKTVL